MFKKRVKMIVWLFSAGFSMLLFNNCLSEEPEQVKLKEVFKDSYKIGTALNAYQILGKDQKSITLLREHFNSITPENILKWEKVHPSPGNYNFEIADSFVSIGEKYNMFVVGHTLVWHSQTPRWVFQDEAGNAVSRDTLLERMKNHIFTVAGRYKGKIQGWDVVNEAVNDDGTMRNSPWMKIIGDDYIEKAFRWANEADPDAELYYNDYNMWHEGKRDAVVRLIKDLQEKGVKIDGIGLQGHWGLNYPPINELEAALKAYSQLGVKLMITELDMEMLPSPQTNTGAEISQNFELQEKLNPYPDALPDSMQIKQANRYAEFFKLFGKYKDNITRVTFWGIQDGQSWRNNWPVRGRTDYPLLFDRNYQPKPAVDAIIKAVTGK